MPKDATDEFKQSALELLDDGMTQKQVCADLGISKSAVRPGCVTRGYASTDSNPPVMSRSHAPRRQR